MIRVLVVDDNAEYRDVFVRILDHQPDMGVVAQAGSLAEARAKLGEIDVVILDRGLPDGDGLGFIGEVREANPGANVLVMSITIEQAHPTETTDAGAVGVLDKLSTPGEIVERVREAVVG